ncbi:MAG: hypothetical protein GXP03_15275, partial [Alphaproteobacteria bacterium]|nr:hypothetical protein [Alphaproteobacteria bacterium]
MAGFIVTNILTSTYTLDYNTFYYIARLGGVFSTSGNAIESATTMSRNERLTIAGEVSSVTGSGLELTGTSIAGDPYSWGSRSVSILKSGIVSSYFDAVRMYGDGNEFTNAGSVQGWSTGVNLKGDAAALSNSGEIIGTAGTGIYLRGDYNAIDQSNLYNSGLIYGAFSAVSVRDSEMIVVNDGILSSKGVTITITGANSKFGITNNGSISTTADPSLSTSLAVSGSVNSDFLRNSGTITGAVDLMEGNDQMRNEGTVSGFVSLGAGNDVYKGVNTGTVGGTIDGGTGDDVLKGGNLGDDMNGGAGIDILKGRGGDDTLTDTDGNDQFWGGSGDDVMTAGAGANKMYGGTGNDTIVAGSGSDTVHG